MSFRSVLFVKKTGVSRWKPKNLEKKLDYQEKTTAPRKTQRNRKYHSIRWKPQYQEKIREPGNTTISGENQKTWKKLDYQGNSQYQVKTTAPEKKPRETGNTTISGENQKTSKKNRFPREITVLGENHSTKSKPQNQGNTTVTGENQSTRNKPQYQ